MMRGSGRGQSRSTEWRRRLPNVDRSARLPLIWLVDDSRTQVAFTERALGAAYRFERFEDGPSVIQRLGEGTVLPDLVLLDWVMPGLSGDEVCRFLRANPA